MDAVTQFQQECRAEIEAQGEDADLHALSRIWLREITPSKYHYHFTWLGRPIIQLPQDMIAVQEILWRTNPDLVIETGVAHGGSLILSASILELLGGERRVIGIDVDVREHNRQLIESHPLAKRIQLVTGSSIDPQVVNQVRAVVARHHRIMVILDSNHTHQHVLRELELYAPLVTKDCYLIVFDTLIERMPERFCEGRPWGRGNNPMTAVREFLRGNPRFVVDRDLTNQLLISAAPDGYLRCVTSPTRDE